MIAKQKKLGEAPEHKNSESLKHRMLPCNGIMENVVRILDMKTASSVMLVQGFFKASVPILRGFYRDSKIIWRSCRDSIRESVRIL